MNENNPAQPAEQPLTADQQILEISRMFLKTRRALGVAINWLGSEEPTATKEVILKHLSDTLEEVNKECLTFLESV